MQVIGYESDNVLRNLGTQSLVTLLFIGLLMLSFFLYVTFKVLKYEKG